MITRRDADRARWFVAEFGEAFELRLDVLEMMPNCLQQTFACLGRRHAPRRTREQAKAKSRLQRTHSVAQRGLRDAQLCGRLRKAPVLRYGDKGEQIVDVFSRHL